MCAVVASTTAATTVSVNAKDDGCIVDAALSTIENWIFNKPVTVYSDHNPLIYITESATKTAKLMRWALALQQYDVVFKFKAGRANVVADCLSRLDN